MIKLMQHAKMTFCKGHSSEHLKELTLEFNKAENKLSIVTQMDKVWTLNGTCKSEGEERMQDHFVKYHFAYHFDKRLDILFISVSV